MSALSFQQPSQGYSGPVRGAPLGPLPPLSQEQNVNYPPAPHAGWQDMQQPPQQYQHEEKVAPSEQSTSSESDGEGSSSGEGSSEDEDDDDDGADDDTKVVADDDANGENGPDSE